MARTVPQQSDGFADVYMCVSPCLHIQINEIGSDHLDSLTTTTITVLTMQAAQGALPPRYQVRPLTGAQTGPNTSAKRPETYLNFSTCSCFSPKYIRCTAHTGWMLGGHLERYGGRREGPRLC